MVAEHTGYPACSLLITLLFRQAACFLRPSLSFCRVRTWRSCRSLPNMRKSRERYSWSELRALSVLTNAPRPRVGCTSPLRKSARKTKPAPQRSTSADASVRVLCSLPYITELQTSDDGCEVLSLRVVRAIVATNTQNVDLIANEENGILAVILGSSAAV